jgi:hypothetical protein
MSNNIIYGLLASSIIIGEYMLKLINNEKKELKENIQTLSNFNIEKNISIKPIIINLKNTNTFFIRIYERKSKIIYSMPSETRSKLQQINNYDEYIGSTFLNRDFSELKMVSSGDNIYVSTYGTKKYDIIGDANTIINKLFDKSGKVLFFKLDKQKIYHCEIYSFDSVYLLGYKRNNIFVYHAIGNYALNLINNKYSNEKYSIRLLQFLAAFKSSMIMLQSNL